MLVICSAVSGLCDKGWEKNATFPDWDSCMRQGYVDSLQVLDIMGTDYVNVNKSFTPSKSVSYWAAGCDPHPVLKEASP